MEIKDNNELRKTRPFWWCAYLFTFMFGSARVPLGLNKLWLPGQERKKNQDWKWILQIETSMAKYEYFMQVNFGLMCVRRPWKIINYNRRTSKSAPWVLFRKFNLLLDRLTSWFFSGSKPDLTTWRKSRNKSCGCIIIFARISGVGRNFNFGHNFLSCRRSEKKDAKSLLK